jgi:hypothetical protein
LKTFHKILIILILQLVCIQQNIYAQDTLVVAKPVKHKFKPETMRATMLAVAFPGLGQVYNRKIWKIPVVYVGFGALIYTAQFNSKNYIMYLKAYQDFTDNNPNTISYQHLIAADPSTYDQVKQQATYLSYKGAMLLMVDYYKRYRDLSYIGIAGWYLISILDANVDASLFNYDISDNLDVAVLPVQMPLPGGSLGAGLGVSFKVTF